MQEDSSSNSLGENVPKLRFPGFEGEWQDVILKNILKETKEFTSDFDSYPLYSLTIEGGVTPKTDRYERSFLVKRESDSFKIVRPNDFVLNPMNLRFGSINYNKEPFPVSVSGYYNVFTIDEGEYNSFWNAYFKTNKSFYKYEAIATGSLIEKRRVHYTSFAKLHYYVPDVLEKQKIVKFLDLLDKKIDIQYKLVESLKLYKRGLLAKFFPQKGKSVPQCRFQGFTGDWEQRKFENIVDRVTVSSADDCILPRIEYEDIVPCQGLLNKNIYEKVSDKKGILFIENDILFGKLRPYLKNWIMPDFQGVAVGDFWVLRGTDVSQNFIYTLVQSDNFEEVANQSTGTKMPRSDWKLVSQTAFSIPRTVEEQQKIGIYFENFDRLIALHQQKIHSIEEVKSALLQQMFI